MSTPDRPDVVIVVMDTVRAFDFPLSPSDRGGTSLEEDLRRDWVEFPRAVTTAPWTIPSHASLFTGLYPWMHGVHHKGALKLEPSIPRLASILSSRGYRTLGLAGNAFLTPISGLLDGFETVGWCRWIDFMVRAWPRLEPAFFGEFQEGLRQDVEGRDSNLVSEVKGVAYNGLLKFPYTMEGFNRLLRHLGNGPEDYAASPWIEREFRKWVQARQDTESIFAFVNLMDAHDPYLSDLDTDRSIAEWWPKLRVSQAPADYYLNRWSPGHGERESLHRLYLCGIKTVSRRVMQIISTLRECERWENTLFILTSDHGNAFDEDGILYHGLKVTEPIARVPLWVRFPRGRFAGQRAKGWASLIDVLPTVLAETGIVTGTVWPGVFMRELIENDRKTPVIAVADGIRALTRRPDLYPEEIRRRLDRVWVAVYEGENRVLYDDQAGQLTAYSTSLDGNSGPGHWVSDLKAPAHLEEVARQAAKSMQRKSDIAPDEEVDRRLTAWGY
jgi:arylsulfatase A-like enzyme